MRVKARVSNQGLGHGSGCHGLTQVSVKVKIVIIIFLKLDSEQGLCHWSRPESQVGLAPESTKKIVIIIVLKPVSRAYPRQDPGHEWGWPLTWVNIRKKNSYYHSFKTWLEDRPRSCVKRVNPNQHKIKVIIIIFLKFDSGVNSGIDPSHKMGEWTWVNSGQYKDKNCYYHSFKTRFEGSLGLSLGHGPGGSIWVNLSQCMDKSDY